ncbi:PREDICTED: MAGUK p55 subfamily member 5-like isoform X4 [Branchiostoma belcheri]|uniref:Protein PALS1 n=1 Tax=Branchiostoma belcheri TaxID=7741 RepID=A0A6P4Z4Z2_BRABE|nr:PREDICTED: MAGUK p55 subfamily member 5-like isoform X4 [Branchiostoma belcheri]
MEGAEEENFSDPNVVDPEEMEVSTELVLLSSDKRFGFSVMGGADEGFSPRVDEIAAGSPADRADLEVGDEILEVNGESLENATHSEIIAHIHKCIKSRTICLRVKRRNGLPPDLTESSNSIQQAYVIAVEDQAKERLERLAERNRVKPIDMTNMPELTDKSKSDMNGVVDSPVYVASIPKNGLTNGDPTLHDGGSPVELLHRKDIVDDPIISPVKKDSQKLVLDYGKLNGPNGAIVNGNGEPRANGPTSLHHDETDLNGDTDPFQESSSDTTLPSNNSTMSSDSTAQMNGPMVTVNHVPSNNVPREVPVDCPPNFVAQSGMKDPPPAYTHPSSEASTPINTPQTPPPTPIHPPDPKETQDNTNMDLAGAAIAASSLPASNSPVPRGGPGMGSARFRQHQEEVRRRREEEERRTREAEQLVREGSIRMRKLEENPVPLLEEKKLEGVDNPLFEDDDAGSVPPKPGSEARKSVELDELFSSLGHIQGKLNSREADDVAFLKNLFHDSDFQTAVRIHNLVSDVYDKPEPPVPVATNAVEVSQEVKTLLPTTRSQDAEELAHILNKPNVGGLLLAHDRVAAREVLPPNPDDGIIERASQYTEDTVKIVRIDKSQEALGATVRNEGDAVLIARIVKGGAAEKSGLLHEGDEVLEINGKEVRGKSVNEVCDMMAEAVGTITFLLIPCQDRRQKGLDGVVHVRAHFDYDPLDDMYIPCRELGLSFQKGDILHIVNQDDPNWWQSFREGEEDQSLAGLVPSRSFQQQREAMKQTLEDDKEPKKKGKLLCAKKNKKKKKKKVLYNAAQNEDYDLEEILTYEEVVQYRQPADSRRPVVLIGPPNVGRHELRQRLMESDPEKYTAAVPHTSRSRKDQEVDGKDYHFIPRGQFEQDILAGKFVEHGEYEKNIYGTSLDAIRRVINSNKVCVLNLHPQDDQPAVALIRALKILKSSDLKPFIVFVAPPGLEKLRQLRNKMGDHPKDEELRETIEKAREIELNFGHYFDYVIVNGDLDRAYNELLREIGRLETEAMWVPAAWVSSASST